MCCLAANLFSTLLNGQDRKWMKTFLNWERYSMLWDLLFGCQIRTLSIRSPFLFQSRYKVLFFFHTHMFLKYASCWRTLYILAGTLPHWFVTSVAGWKTSIRYNLCNKVVLETSPSKLFFYFLTLTMLTMFLILFPPFKSVITIEVQIPMSFAFFKGTVFLIIM